MQNNKISQSIYLINQDYNFYSRISEIYLSQLVDPLSIVKFNSIFNDRNTFDPYNNMKFVNYINDNIYNGISKKRQRKISKRNT